MQKFGDALYRAKNNGFNDTHGGRHGDNEEAGCSAAVNNVSKCDTKTARGLRGFLY
ncbi:MAG: hypothetical protein LBB48_04790 [Treponema sp.]|jgi:hypothetical protein|nr:hypothetical protein [Treponema sp.]